MGEPMTSPWRRLAAFLTVLLSAAIVAVLGLSVADGRIGSSPSATPSASGSPSPAPSASASASRDALAVFAEIEDQVVALRELPAADIGPPDVIGRDALAAILADELDATWTDEELAADNLAMRAMGLLTADQDIRELIGMLYEEQVLGFYDFEAKRMVVVTDAGLTPVALITYAHEYTHALQDAAFDTLAGHEATLGDDDAALARLSLEEGDATLVMIRWALSSLPPEDLAGIGATPLPDTSGFPDWMVAQLELPYLAGFQFVLALQQSGGWGAVDDAYDAPPASTEQLLHPDKYLAGEEPLVVEPLDLAGHMGAGWEEVPSTPIGEAMVGIWLQHLGVADGTATDAAADWGGDRLQVASSGSEWAMAWTLAWDSATDADEFADAYLETTKPAGMDTRLVRTSGTTTVVLHASTAAVLDRAGGALTATLTSSLVR